MAVHHCLSVFVFLWFWTPFRICCLPCLLSLSDGWLIQQMFSSFWLSLCLLFTFCLADHHLLLPAHCQVSASVCWILSVYTLWLSVCLIHPPVPPQNLGPSILAGVTLMVLLIPFNGAVAVKMRDFQVGALSQVHRSCLECPARCLGRGIY